MEFIDPPGINALEFSVIESILGDHQVGEAIDVFGYTPLEYREITG